jgi:hypothetical protein
MLRPSAEVLAIFQLDHTNGEKGRVRQPPAYLGFNSERDVPTVFRLFLLNSFVVMQLGPSPGIYGTPGKQLEFTCS